MMRPVARGRLSILTYTFMYSRVQRGLAGDSALQTVRLQTLSKAAGVASARSAADVRGLDDRVLRCAAVTPDQNFDVNDAATLLDLVEAGLGVALMPADRRHACGASGV